MNLTEFVEIVAIMRPKDTLEISAEDARGMVKEIHDLRLKVAELAEINTLRDIGLRG
jgi:hypothetical protein